MTKDTRLCRTTHKMKIKEEEGELWFNKACRSDRIASTIHDGSKNAVYMYVGGGAVDSEQSYLLSGILILCKSWKWAALSYTATRLAGLASCNYFGSMREACVFTSSNSEPCEDPAASTSPEAAFCMVVEEQWRSLEARHEGFAHEPRPGRKEDRAIRTAKAGQVMKALAAIRAQHGEVSQMLSCTEAESPGQARD